MTFLAPIPAIIAAAICIPALLTFYLLKLRRTPTRVSSTIFWQRAAKDLEANVPLRWLRPSWTLFLHLLMLAALLIALARPAIDAGPGAAGRLLILIDRSASMSTADGPDGASRLEHAKQLAREEIGRLRANGYTGAIAVASFDDRARPHASLTPDIPIAIEAIDGIAPSDLPGDLTVGLELAESILQQGVDEDDDTEEAEVWLFSDGADEFRERGRSLLALRGASMRFFPVGPAAAESGDPPAIDNIGITSFTAARTHTDPTKLRIALTLQSSIEQPTVVTLETILDGRRMQREALTIPAATRPPPPSEDDASPTGDEPVKPGQPGALRPGALPHALVLDEPRGGLLELKITRRDALAADDRVTAILPQASRIVAQLITPDTMSADQRSAANLTARILQSLTESSVRERSITAYNALPTPASEADLLVFFDVEPATAPQIATISLGAGMPVDGLRATDIESVSERAIITTFDRNHPTLRGVGLDRLRMIRLGTLIPPPTDAQAPEILARTDAGPVIAFANDSGFRRLVVTFPVEDSGWPQSTAAYFSFIVQSTTFMTRRAEAISGTALRTSDPVELVPLQPSGVLRVISPEGETVVDREAPGSLEPVGVGRFERVGVYRVEGAELERLPVNMLDPSETASLVSPTVTVSGVQVDRTALGERAKREIWDWFVIIAALLLTIEWLIYTIRMRI